MMLLRSDIGVACAVPIKLLAYTSISHHIRYRICGFCGSIVTNLAKVFFTRGCSRRLPTLCLARSSAISLTFSDAAKKYGGDLFHSIWRLPGMTISVSLMCFSGRNLDRTYAKFHTSYGTTLSIQQTSFMSYLEKYHGPMSIEDTAIVEMIHGNTRPSMFMDSCGASLVVLSFTAG